MISFCTLSTFRSCIQEISSLSVLFASLWHFSVLLCGYFLHAIILYSVRSMCSDVCPSVCIWCWDFPEVTLAEVDTNPILTDEYMTQWNTCYFNPTDGISTVANQTFMRSYIRVQRCYIREAYFNFWDKIEDWFSRASKQEWEFVHTILGFEARIEIKQFSRMTSFARYFSA